jgi:Ca2+-binding RTX toxin-like protein
LGGVAIPFDNQATMAGLLGLPSVVAPSLTSVQSLLASAFPGGSVTDADATWSQVQSALNSAGFQILSPTGTQFPGTPDPTHNNSLLEISFTPPSATLQNTQPVSLNVAENSPFQYLNNGFFAGFSATAQFSGPNTITFGVDAPNGTPTFFVLANPTTFTVSLSNSIAANTIDATLEIGDLASVTATNASAEQMLSLTGSLGFQSVASNPLDAGGKVRASDFSNLGQVIQPNVNGVAQLNLTFSTQLAMLGSVGWSGSFSEAIQNGQLQAPSVNLQLNESPTQLLLNLVQPIADALVPETGLGILGPLQSSLDDPLPLINESIAQLTGLDNHLPELPALGSGSPNASSVISYLSNLGITINDGDTSAAGLASMVSKLIAGNPVDLISWSASGDVNLVNYDFPIPLYSIGVPDIASVEIDATFGLDASLHYHVGFDVNSDGLYLDAGTPDDPTLGLSFGVTAGLQGQVEVFGFPLAEVGGNLGFSITPYITLTAPPWAADPSRVYLSDLALFGSNPASDILDDLALGIQGDLTGSVYASIDLFLFHIGWSWGIDIPVFNYERLPSWPARPGGGGSAPSWANAVLSPGGVLTFTADPPGDASGGDKVTVSSDANNNVTISWPQAKQVDPSYLTSETFPAVTEFIFKGGSGNDMLTAASGFSIPTRAVAGSGNDSFQFQGATGSDTLVGGSNPQGAASQPNDTLVAGSGKDVLIAGSGNDSLQGGSGSNSSDTIYGGSGSDSITAGNGHESIYGGSGTDTITAGTGTTGTYFIDGGSGSYSTQNPEVIDLSQNTGSGDSIYGGTSGDNLIKGSTGGDNRIYGDGPGDTIYGAGGSDTIYGGAGSSPLLATNNLLYGGPAGGNVIHGGGAGDTLVGGGGSVKPANNTVYGGTGNETLYGGAGTDKPSPNATGVQYSTNAPLSTGSSMLIAGPGNDALFGDSSGQNTLYGGFGNDSLYAGTGGDYLAAGDGGGALYGGRGNDTFELPFSATGQHVAIDPGSWIDQGQNTLVLKPAAAEDPQLLVSTVGSPISSTTSTITVTNAADLTAANSGNFLIRIDGEQMLVTGVSGNTLTVVRGYTQQTGNTTTGSNATTLTGLDTSHLTVGQPVFGPANVIPSGTTIASILSPSAIALSNTATAAGTGVLLGFGDGPTESSHSAGALVVAPNAPVLDASTTTISVTDAPALIGTNSGNLVLQIDKEQMLVTGVSGNTITVVRGYNNTAAATHLTGAAVVIAKPTLVGDAPSLAAPVTSATATTLTVTNVTALAPASLTNFVILVDNEQMLVQSISGSTLTVVQRGYNGTASAIHNLGALVSVISTPTLVASSPTIVSAIGDTTSTSFVVSDAQALAPTGAPNFIIQVDNEQMLVTALAGNTLTVVRGYSQDVGNTAAGSATITGLANASVLVVGQPIAGAGILSGSTVASINVAAGSITISQAATTTATGVVLGFSNGSTAATHLAGTAITTSRPVALDTAATTIMVANAALLAGPNSTPFVIQIDQEQMLVTNVSTNTFNVVRGYSQDVGKTTAGSTTITGLTQASALVVGQPVAGPGIPSGSTIASINAAAESITISQAATATASVLLGFSGGATVALHYTGAVVILPPPILVLPVSQATTNATSTLTVSNAAGLAPSNGYDVVIQVDDEEMLVTAVSGNTVTVLRGFNTTAPVAHNAGVSILTAGAPVLDPTTTTIMVANASALAPANEIALQITGMTQTGSQIVTGLSSMSGLGVGQAVTAPGYLPANTQIVAINAASGSITLSNSATAAGTGISLTLNLVIRIDQEQILVSAASFTTGALTVQRGYNGTTPSVHSAGSFVLLETPAPAAPSNYKIYFTQVTGASNQYHATLYDLNALESGASNAAAQLGVMNLSTQPGAQAVQQVALEGGPGNNVIQVDPSVTLDLLLYGGPGDNTLIAGGGSDTLAAGSGNSVLYGGAGDDVLFAGDAPQQDNLPVLDAAGHMTPQAGTVYLTGNTTQGNITVPGSGETITLPSTQSTAGLSLGDSVIAPSAIPAGTTITSVSTNSITISNPATLTVTNLTLIFSPTAQEGNDTLIAGTGNSELYAGNGNDLLIGGTAVQAADGQWQLKPGAGRDVLVGGSGADLLIAGPGSPGAGMYAGSGNDTLVGENSGMDIIQGGPGNDLLLGGNGQNVIQGGSGIQTLVAGLGFNTLLAGSGIDRLYSYPDQALWTQAQAAAKGQPYAVTLVSQTGAGQNPTTLQGQIQSVLQQGIKSNQPMPTLATQTVGQPGLLDQDFQQLKPGETTVGQAIAALLATQITQGLTTGQQDVLAYLQTQHPTMLLGDLVANLLNTQITQGLQQQYPLGQSPDPLSTLAYLLRQEDPTIHDELTAILISVQQTSPQPLPINQQYLLLALLLDENDFLKAEDLTLQFEMAPLQGLLPSQRTVAQQTELTLLTGEDDEFLSARILVQNELLNNGAVGNLLQGYIGANGTGQDYFYTLNGNDTVQGGPARPTPLSSPLMGRSL